MPEQQIHWQIQPKIEPPEWFVQAVRQYAELPGNYAAQLLWQRGIRDAEHLAGFLKPQLYKPASPFEFGQEMHWAIERLRQAINAVEIVAIWGDFDADGITSTAVLWDGLGQFFAQNINLLYYVPNRLTESHGLNFQGIADLAERGVKLIVTCDTGSTNLSEIEYARELGIDIIVTDHHTLLPERPPVTAIINPRNLSPSHQLFNLSGVAVAYKLIEALYQTLPDIPKQPLEDLLGLVAIGLIADLVNLKGDCRYLAQLGIEKLQEDLQNPPKLRRRPGVGNLLEFCKKSGDRPTDISFGIGPRINAVSRIQGDASFCVELLTSREIDRVEKLARETELANARRKSLQKDVEQQAAQKLAQLDLSTTSIIVLTEMGWPVGVLGLVAGQVAQQTGLPTILLSLEEAEENIENDREISQSKIPNAKSKIARGSARSVNQIDLYQLVKAQAHLLDRFGGHPLAAGLSIPVENIPLFTEAINQQLRQQIGGEEGKLGTRIISADLVVTVADLGINLFRELKLLEPCGMGNSVPQLVIQDCWFENIKNRNIQDATGKKVQYIKTEFQICDRSAQIGFPGVWWGHYKDEIPPGQCDAVVELDFNTYNKRYEVRLIAVRSRQSNLTLFSPDLSQTEWILDWRNKADELQIDYLNLPIEEGMIKSEISNLKSQINEKTLIVRECPSHWDDLQLWFRRALQAKQQLAIAYPPPPQIPPSQVWQNLVGIAKYLSRTGKTATQAQLQQKLGIGDTTLLLGLQTLTKIGFEVKNGDGNFKITGNTELEASSLAGEIYSAIAQFLAAVREEQFRRQYFYEVPLDIIRSVVNQNTFFQND
ncbi:single-stranded-DNA-specific exonuclease RecJ [Planktothrix sp. FACHB-1355]|uniref:Single-stranded-DNA-specific exonuclease RecJ n=1 Tax=Aerosakkonema funiforme FACHB-1375 TaxID=2949571 RepID=A0A926ZHG3_9CYAN|nr:MULTISPECIES: single-stranded-DNA-specific exonuclease RecJ [Oscillatoriales]MBD2182152.1 single-stranded-DNA-specific exonuclease RecJ [Aerosakkonema funiforme FACHB-1375]MBD3558766.1 single-stranded-DNA-specific exonuclease RecJ [Planktothrix sp. FACHB-1355]